MSHMKGELSAKEELLKQVFTIRTRCHLENQILPLFKRAQLYASIENISSMRPFPCDVRLKMYAGCQSTAWGWGGGWVKRKRKIKTL